MNDLQQKHATGDYICVINMWLGVDNYYKEENPDFIDFNVIKHYLIHKKDESVLNAFLEDNKIGIEYKIARQWYRCTDIDETPNFIIDYNGKYSYRLKEEDFSNIANDKACEDLEIVREHKENEEFISVPNSEIKFKKPEHSCELFEIHNDIIYGRYDATPCSWFKSGKIHNNGVVNLTPIKKPWYMNKDNFPTLVTDGGYFQVAYEVDEEKNMIVCQDGVRLNLSTWKLATNEEIESLKITK